MTKNEYIIYQLSKKYPDLVKQEETSYILAEMDRINGEQHFKEFLKKLNCL
jgi:reverse gyrase